MTHFPFYPTDVANRLEQYAAEYVFEQTEPTPWTPLRRALRECKTALITTAGIRLKTQHEFRSDRTHGCAEWREISVYATTEDIAYDFTDFDPREAERDLNVIAPVARLKELVDHGVFAGLNETFFSFFGLCDDLPSLKSAAQEVAHRLRSAYDVQVCFLFPANLICNQTVSLLSREIERTGLSTITLVTIKEIAQQIKVPRPLFINFPFGRTLGTAEDVATQRAIVGDMVRVLKSHDRPARLEELPYTWKGVLD